MIIILDKQYEIITKEEEATAAVERLRFSQFRLISKHDRTLNDADL